MSEQTLYICNTQHQKPDGTWHTHTPVISKSLEGVAKVIRDEQIDPWSGILEPTKVPRRMQIRTVTLVDTRVEKL
jgi:hypothetical protein